MKSLPENLVLLLLIMLKTVYAFRSAVSRRSVELGSRCAFSSIQTVQPIDINSCIQSKHSSLPDKNKMQVKVQAKFVTESKWRHEAETHKSRVESLLLPGLLQRHDNMPTNSKGGRCLDSRHPIYNFLIEYYGLKGSKGVNRLFRWCPDPFYRHKQSDEDSTIQLDVSFPIENDQDLLLLPRTSPAVLSGVFLENASMGDVNSGTLNLKGATFIGSSRKNDDANGVNGILYSPQLYYGSKDIDLVLKDTDARSQTQTPHRASSAFLWYRTLLRNTSKSEPILYCHGMHEWAMLYNPDANSPPPPSSKYQSHLKLRIPQQTINEQVERKGIRCTHIDALRFFAPEARKWNWYGSLDDLTTEEKGVGVQAKQNVEKLFECCSATDVKLQHSTNTILTRTDQLHLEQKACLHANMDLFKIAWRIQPFISSKILVESLIAALQARTLDVEASPYDVSGYVGLDWNYENVTTDNDLPMPKGTVKLGAVKVESEEGRKEYQQRQFQVMKRGEAARTKLLTAYNDFLRGVFDIEEGETGEFYNAERGQRTNA